MGRSFRVCSGSCTQRALEIAANWPELLKQQQLLDQAIARQTENTHRVDSYDEMKAMLSEQAGFYLVPWHDDADKEREIKDDCKATIRCFPLDAQDDIEGKTCFYSGRPATHMAIFARAY